MDYDFSQLNDKEFEIIAIDLLSILYEKNIERFKPGKDGGVDGRFFSDDNKEIILQAKHYLNTGYKGLISNLKNNESTKVQKLNPARYIFVTSLSLSRNNKNEIKKIFEPYLRRPDDIFGKEDLNDLLRKNPDIEKKHFKLWISSTAVFEKILNNAIKGRSEFEIERIRRNSHKYVQTKNHFDALKILDDKHVLIISGEPGIGKTFLAENLCLFYASEGYEFIDIEESLSEAENVYSIKRKQIFYFDDFLGSNYFEAIENNKDSHILKFIERIKKDKSKRFILTSRTNILNSGIMCSVKFSISKIRKNELMLTIKNLTAYDRAQILYSHIWFSQLKEDFIGEIYKNRRYREIVDHKNYNPRLIEFITDVDRINVKSGSEYWNFITDTLNNPKDIWRTCFKIQNDAYVRNLVKLTVFNGGSISEKDLQNSFVRMNKLEQLRNDSHIEKDFNSAAKVSTKSFLVRNQRQNNVVYTLFNPSIADFVINEYCDQIENLENIFKALNTIESLVQLSILERENIITQDNILFLKNSIFIDAFQQDKDFDYFWL